MLHLELVPEEQEVLSQILERSLAVLEVEIQHTDHQEFKSLLKRRREVLRALITKVPQPLAAAA
jgi:hypothetical protein